MENNQLPADVQERIRVDAEAAADVEAERLKEGNHPDYGRMVSQIHGYHSGYISGATAEALRQHPGPVWVKGDYDRLYDQLKANPEKRIVCYVDYDGFSRRDGSVPCRDICTVRGTQTEFLARGIGYGGAPSWYDEEHRKEEFLQECDRLNVEWLDESASPAAGREDDAIDYQQLKARAEKMEKALEIIANWQLPSTGRYWDHGTNLEPMSYEAAYGSNGVRDYMKNVAAEALSGEEEAPNG